MSYIDLQKDLDRLNQDIKRISFEMMHTDKDGKIINALNKFPDCWHVDILKDYTSQRDAKLIERDLAMDAVNQD